MDLYTGYDRINRQTMCLKKYLPKNKFNPYVHYQDPSFQSKFKGAVLKKDYHIYSLFCRRLRDKSTPSSKKMLAQSITPSKMMISKRDQQLSQSATRYFDTSRLNGDESLCSRDWCMKISSNPKVNKGTSMRNDQSTPNRYRLNFSLPLIPKNMFLGKQALIKNEYLISKLVFFSK